MGDDAIIALRNIRRQERDKIDRVEGSEDRRLLLLRKLEDDFSSAYKLVKDLVKEKIERI